MSTSARMLRLLSLLQTHRYWPGDELAGRLEVSGRTLRRDIDRLRELGYDVDASRGVAGGYQLRAGGSLPPLLLEDEEAVAIAVGLRSAAAGALDGLGDVSVQALTKVIKLMPPRLRRQMDAVSSQTVPAPRRGPVIDAEVLTVLAQGCRDDETLRFGYVARGGEPTERHVEPANLVSLGQRWYLVGYDRDRQDWRTFRLDRISAPRATGTRFRQRDLPASDAVEFVKAGQRSMPRKYDVRVSVLAPTDLVRERLGQWGTVTADGPDACLLEMSTDWLDWPIMGLASLGADFEILGPAELVERVREVGDRFSRCTA